MDLISYVPGTVCTVFIILITRVIKQIGTNFQILEVGQIWPHSNLSQFKQGQIFGTNFPLDFLSETDLKTNWDKFSGVF